MMLGVSSTIALGCSVGVVSSAVQSLGLTLQRQSHLIEDAKPPNVKRRPVFKRTRWKIGLLLFLTANLAGSTVQITTLPLVILSPLQAVGIVFNSIFASIVLAEPFTTLSLIGTILVFVGATLIAAFGSVPEPTHTLNELLLFMHQPRFIAWMTFTLCLCAALLGVVYFGIKRRFLMSGIIYGVCSGILSAHSLLMAKSAVELAVRTLIDRHNQFSRWPSWGIVSAFLCFAISQLHLLNLGLSLVSTSILYPLVFCVYNITAILDGLIYYQQLDKLTWIQILFIVLGTSILLMGVFMLSWRLSDSECASSSEEAGLIGNNQIIKDQPPTTPATAPPACVLVVSSPLLGGSPVTPRQTASTFHHQWFDMSKNNNNNNNQNQGDTKQHQSLLYGGGEGRLYQTFSDAPSRASSQQQQQQQQPSMRSTRSRQLSLSAAQTKEILAELGGFNSTHQPHRYEPIIISPSTDRHNNSTKTHHRRALSTSAASTNAPLLPLPASPALSLVSFADPNDPYSHVPKLKTPVKKFHSDDDPNRNDQ